MAGIDRRRQLLVALGSLAAVLLIGRVVTGSWVTVFTEPLLIVWAVFSAAILWFVFVAAAGKWDDQTVDQIPPECSAARASEAEAVEEGVPAEEAPAVESHAETGDAAIQAAIDEAAAQETPVDEQDRAQFLDSVRVVLDLWRNSSEARQLAAAYLAKAAADRFLNAEFLISMEYHLRDGLPHGQLGSSLFWISGLEQKIRTDIAPIAADTLQFYADSFSLFIRLLEDSVPPAQEYPAVILAQAAWVLLRQCAVEYYADQLLQSLGFMPEQAEQLSREQILNAYVEKWEGGAEAAPTSAEHRLRLACLLTHLRLISSEAADADGFPGTAEGNVLLVHDRLQVLLNEALDRQRLQQFRRWLLEE